MIIHLKSNIDSHIVKELAERHGATEVIFDSQHMLITSSAMKELPLELESITDNFFVLDSDIQLASQSYQPAMRSIQTDEVQFEEKTTIMMAGPCSVESWEQIQEVAELLVKLGVRVLRAGCFKPRTSPYTFQGLGQKGLDLLSKVREIYGLKIITEVKDSSHVDLVIDSADIVQIGTKAMYDQSILRACGRCSKPILLKRGFGSTLQEFVQAAEFILSAGNHQVILCERGIRTFENKTRFTLDLTGVAYLKNQINLPVVVDPSHAMGHRYGVPDLSRAALAMGIQGLLIEVHPDPDSAKSDPAQQLNLNSFESLYKSLSPIAKAIGSHLN